MEKRKYDLGKYADACKVEEFKGADGTVVKVRNHIPYTEKEEMATDFAEHIIMIHEDSCVYVSDQYDKYIKFLIAKYYTDIDTDGADENSVADFLINNDLYNKIEEYIWDDYSEVNAIIGSLIKSVTKTYEDDKCLTKAIRTSFGFLFTGEDITESLAKAELTSDTMFRALSEMRKIDEKKEREIDNGRLSLNGNIINFAKKTE